MYSMSDVTADCHIAVQQAMAKVPRDAFMPYRGWANYNQARITAVMLAALCPALFPENLPPIVNPLILDVGAGSGHSSAVLAQMTAAQQGTVLAVDVVPEWLGPASVSTAKCLPADIAARVYFRGLDARNPFCQKFLENNVGKELLQREGGGWFHAIFVGASSSTLPVHLIQLLRPGGRLVVPIGPPRAPQVLKIATRPPNGASKVTMSTLGVAGCILSPLTSRAEIINASKS